MLMTTTNSRLLDRCPGCAAEPLFAVFDRETTNFLCRTCSRCWHADPAGIHEVDRHTCAGCEWRSTCHSRFG